MSLARNFRSSIKQRLYPANLETRRAMTRLLQPEHNQPVRELDPFVLWPAITLLALGIIMVYSASISIADGSQSTGQRHYYFLMRHLVFVFIGIISAMLAFCISMRRWQNLSPQLFAFGVVLLLAVLVPGLGREVNGAQRWISLGFVNFQPSELMKIFAVLYAADYTVRKLPEMNNFKRGFLPLAIAILIVGFLLLCEPDFGAFAVISAIAFGILFLGGINLRVISLLAVFASAGFALLIWFSAYRRSRIFGFMDPWHDPLDKGYQLTHALIAFGRGEWFGVGLGGSVEKLWYLPEAHTDFILSIIAEELGFAGVFVIIMLFAIIVQRAFAIGREAVRQDRYYSALVAMGIGLWLGVQAFINMGVNMGILPTKGLTLPLMSFGGSATVVTCLALAILLRVDWELRQLRHQGGT